MKFFVITSPICPRRGVAFNDFISEVKEAARGINKKLKVTGYSITDGPGNCDYEHNLIVEGITDDCIQFMDFYSTMLEGKWRWLKEENAVKRNRYVGYH